MTVRNKRIVGVLLGATLLLLVPLLAMQFTDEVSWKVGDFVVAWVLLSGAGLTFELIAGTVSKATYRAGIGVAVAAALFLVWANLAVGLIGSENNLANLMYVAVLAVGVIGAIFARLESTGMVRTMYATAIAQTLVTTVALIAGMHNLPDSSASKFVGMNFFFVALWIGSALLFRRASSAKSSSA